MKIPMGPVTKGYFRHFRLAPTQCTGNMFRILGCVDALNEKMGLRLTHHDVNWCYNLQKLKGKNLLHEVEGRKGLANSMPP